MMPLFKLKASVCCLLQLKENAVWINWVFVQTNNFVISSDDDDPHLSEEHDPQSSRWMEGICKESLLP